MKKVILSAMMMMAMMCFTTNVNAQDNVKKEKKECCEKKQQEKKECCEKKNQRTARSALSARLNVATRGARSVQTTTSARKTARNKERIPS